LEVQKYIEPVNARLEQETKALAPGTRWMNLFPSFLKSDGTPDSAFFRAGVHLTLKGCETWRAKRLPVLNAIRNGTPVHAR
jgi:hypothetical protein